MLKKATSMARKMPATPDQARDFLVNLNQDPKIGYHPSIAKKERTVKAKKGGKK